MSGVLHPVGPESPGTYWFRRILVLAVVVVVVAVVAYACSGGGSGKSAGPSPHRTPTTPTTAPTSTPKTHPNRCTSRDVGVTLSTGKRSYPVGATPTLNATLSNTTDAACTLVSGAVRMHWAITSGHDKVWSTAGCVTSKAVAVIRVKPHAERRFTTTWNGRRMDPNCTVGQPATAGTYVLSATIDGLPAKSVVFQLTG